MGLREPFNSVSHMVGAGLAIAVLPVFIFLAWNDGALALTCAIVYGLSMVAVFVMSATYHGVTHAKAAEWLLRLDQSMIYLLIAGTYTPVALLVAKGVTGWVMFGVQWSLAITGIVLLLTVHKTPQWIHQSAYIVLGWAAVAALPNLLKMPWPALALLLLGGVAYTGGSYLYNRNRLTTWGIGDHGLWHLLVIFGAAAHATIMLVYVF